MEPFPAIDYAGAATTYTPFVMTFLQVIKQSPKVDNAKLPYYAVIIGVIMAVGILAVTGRLVWTPNGFLFDPVALFKSVIEGFVGGGAAPLGYSIQKQLPVKLLQPGPDNFGQPKPTNTQGAQ